ncbi:MAG: FmdE family protein [Archaeoglobaceae archaeon]
MDSDSIEFAIRLHGYLSPGLALGMRMAEIARRHLGTNLKGKALIGIAETSFCVPDALQVVVGTTVGNWNLIVKEYGKLALSVVRSDTMEGYRVSLKKEVANNSGLMRSFILRDRKLSSEEKIMLAKEFLSLDERYFDIRKIRLKIPVRKKKEGIFECENCGELQPNNYMVEREGKKLCPVCSGDSYFDEIK